MDLSPHVPYCIHAVERPQTKHTSSGCRTSRPITLFLSFVVPICSIPCRRNHHPVFLISVEPAGVCLRSNVTSPASTFPVTNSPTTGVLTRRILAAILSTSSDESHQRRKHESILTTLPLAPTATSGSCTCSTSVCAEGRPARGGVC